MSLMSPVSVFTENAPRVVFFCCLFTYVSLCVLHFGPLSFHAPRFLECLWNMPAVNTGACVFMCVIVSNLAAAEPSEVGLRRTQRGTSRVTIIEMGKISYINNYPACGYNYVYSAKTTMTD